ncbi:hypothetical protein A2V49_03980 [candidate division WWE3 bacterium RBG_19FT_COMBO_34_6]|uniref:UvrD-like helicase C-terminal domain-containing protein n=1 Tax=candidate division WWE3 bacterium RBG_19FT_COMBO_34_6 TaxID=1802612 RepID=A0A1F4ULS2_UNCKA|nr:MAG: hypothetical protein A2V49_03980 [candidate division WWE3 bacterium RBG_19FT_COMBO_34_6]
MIDLTKEQKNSINTLFEWYKNKNKNHLTLGGYAGTGKTTVISIFRKILFQLNPNIRVSLCSYTGRATRVLEKTLKIAGSYYTKDNISTIHSLIYSPIENANKEITAWRKKEDIEYDLIIIDESSMVDYQIWADLVSFGIPIIAVGDHGQLPPIYGNFNLMESPDIKLNEIHRQNLGNPIIKLSELARKGGYIKPGKYGTHALKYDLTDYDSKDILNHYLESFDKNTFILTGFNSTRVELNKLIRNTYLFETEEPQVNDKVICLKNNHEKGIYNGMIGYLKSINSFNDCWYTAEILFENNTFYSGLIYKPQFNQKSSLNFTDNRKKLIKGDLIDFGYAMTVHKAQGSEADRVIIFEERSRHMDDLMWARWLYTGITRAKKEIYIFGR